jgi:hypothetical protein
MSPSKHRGSRHEHPLSEDGGASLADSLFRRLAVILFAGLLAAHVLSFGLVALNVFGPSNEVSDDYFMRSIATAVAILDRVKPEERSAWLDRFAKPCISIRSQGRRGGI